MFAPSIAGSLPKPRCGLAPMDRDVALRKLEALARGAELARRKFG